MRPRFAEPLPERAARRPSGIGIGSLLALLRRVVVADVAARRDPERLEVRAEEIRARSGDGGSKYAGGESSSAISPMLYVCAETGSHISNQ